jgi:hypothetical protein
MLLDILLRQTRTNLFVRFEMRFLAVLVAVRYAMAFETLLQRFG